MSKNFYITLLIISTFLLRSALGNEEIAISGGYDSSKNQHIKTGELVGKSAITYGNNGDKDKGSIRLEFNPQQLKNITFYYAGYPNGASLRYELQDEAGKNVRIDAVSAGDIWKPLSFQIPQDWEGKTKKLWIVATDDTDSFQGWVGIGAGPKQTFSEIFSKMNLILSTLWILFVALILVGPVFLLANIDCYVRIAVATLLLCILASVAFYLALLLRGQLRWTPKIGPEAKR